MNHLRRRLALLLGILRGRKALAEGRTLTHEQVMAKTAKWA